MKSEFGTEQGHLEELSKANDIIHMAKFEILMEKAKGKPRQSKAPTVEQKSDVCEEEQQQKDLDIEQEVKEAEQKNTHRMWQERWQIQERRLRGKRQK